MGVGIKVILAEVYEFLFETRFSPQGTEKVLPGTNLSSIRSLAVSDPTENLELELARGTLQADQTF